MNERGLGTHIVCQIGVVVRDIERAIGACSRLFDLPRPGFIITDTVDVAHTEFKGQPTDARAKLAFFDMGQVSLEFIEPIGGPSTWQEFLDRNGEGVHHIALTVKDTDEALAHLEKQSIGVIQRGDYRGGRYTYVDSVPALGVILELLENF